MRSGFAPSARQGIASPTPIAEALLRRWSVAHRATSTDLKRRVHDTLKGAILSRELLPGDVISERQIERIFRVSRIPVREALKVLEAQGWVSSLPRRGTRILGLNRTDVREIFLLREYLEPLAARLAARAMTPAHQAWFRSTLDAMARSLGRGALDTFVRQDLAVHTRIAHLSGNGRLEAIITGLGEDIRRLGAYSISVRGRHEASLVEHRHLARALSARDGDAAARRMLTHLVNTRNTILGLTIGRTSRGRHASIEPTRLPGNRPLRHRETRGTRHGGG